MRSSRWWRTAAGVVLPCITLVVLWAPKTAIADDTAGADAADACTLAPGPVRTVTRVLDAETLTLDDGSEVRLIGALAPRALDAGAVVGAWPAENEAIETLSTLVLGKSVKLAYGGRRADRYGRHLAHVFVQNRGASEWVQGALLDAGAARAYGLPGSFVCARELLIHERDAREAGRGLWASEIYSTKPAARPGYLMSLRSRYERVDGTILSVSQTKSALYLNFGDDWKSDFTARVGKDVSSANPAWAADLEQSKDRRVVVRGWIERRNGPMIDVLDPSQIEIWTPEPGSISRAPRGADTMTAPAGGNDDGGSKQLRPGSTIETPGAADL